MHFDFLLRSPAADRYQYLASLGPLVGAGALAGGWIERRAAAARTWGRAAAALVLALLALLTARQAAVYRSEESLFRYAHRYAPDSSFVAYNLGVALMDKGRYAEAETWFADAVRLEPDNWMAVANWGGMLIAQKKYAAAVAVYGRAVEGGCTEPLVYCNLTFLLSTSSDPAVRRPAEALRVANLAVRKFGANDPKYLSVLATAESANGHVAEAVANARRALRLAQERNDAALVKKLQMLLPMFEKGQTPSM